LSRVSLISAPGQGQNSGWEVYFIATAKLALHHRDAFLGLGVTASVFDATRGKTVGMP
jgi:hypothetical protein